MNRHQRRAEKKQNRSATPSASPAVQNALAEGLRHHQAGRLADAERLYRQILAIDPEHADSLHLLGIIAHQMRSYDVAADLIGRAIKGNAKVSYYHGNLGLVLSAQGKLDAAVASYRRALALQPNYIEACNNLGNALIDQGKLEEAVASFRRALVLDPKFADSHNNLGNALKEQGKLEEAAASYRRAIALRPAYAEAHSNLGIALATQGKLDEAVICYRQALALKPDIAEVHNNLGTALREQGTPDEALACYRRALTLKPGYVDALNNLALLLTAQGDVVGALTAVKQSLQIKEASKAKSIFVDCVKNYRGDGDHEIQSVLVRALNEPWCRPSKLARVSTDLLKHDPEIGRRISLAANAWPRRLSAIDLFGTNGLAVLGANELLHALLCSTQICDIALERFLTMARCLMLDAAVSGGDADTGLSFHAALVRQCFINEYVFSCADDEIEKLADVRDRLAAAVASGGEIPVLWILAVAAYVPLSQLPFAARLQELQWPEEVAAIIVQQIVEPAKEQQLRESIPRLTTVKDDVSKMVRSQYEENPYPRWVKIESAGNARTILEYMSQQFPLAACKTHGSTSDILIAGCGTGQQSIGMAHVFKNARVLAVDLSLSSLGYAKRMTRELGLTSIDYAQADLLELGSLNRQFDVVASVGVLHHLADPFAGWRTLLSLVRPGGFMNLGFYSELARRDIVRAQGFVAGRGFATTAEDIRKGRQELVDLNGTENFGTTTSTIDFFAISTCRDLLFHVQEQRTTLADIDVFVRENKLTFLGFEIDSAVLRAYRRRFPNDPAAVDLGQWQAFENENPDTFIGMYQFWIQKAA